MSNDKNSETAFVVLREEIEKYISLPEADFIYACYSTVSSHFDKTSREKLLLLHSLKTALDLARFRLNTEFVGSALLYYPVVTKRISISQVKSNFGERLTKIIQALIQIGDLLEQQLPWSQMHWSKVPAHKVSTNKRRKESSQSSLWSKRSIEYAPNVFFALARTPEIAVIKLIDRLHLLKDGKKLLGNQNLHQELAKETLNLHSIVAERLGISSVKWQLEDAAFSVLQPDAYQAIENDLKEGYKTREERLSRAIAILSNALEAKGVSVQIKGRPKHIYGLYLKMTQSGKTAHEINDNLGIRILVNTVAECYLTRDILFQTWPPAEDVYGYGLFRDWIAKPKPNGYQSIHTTVRYTEDRTRLLEVQIRTREMNELAEYGAAAHWIYKKASNASELERKYQKYVRELTELRLAFEKRQKAG